MTVRELYQQYQIKRNLQQHMMRVAGVAELICDHISLPVDRHEVLNACLLHDMGNIIKFDLTYFPEFLEPEGLAYWQKVKAQFIERYGKNEHQATITIAAEIHASKRTLELIDSISFNLEKENYETDDFSRKVCAYADMRVAPYGVVTLDERLEDGWKRYENPNQENAFGYVMAAFLKKIEAQIFAHCDISSEDVTDENIQKYLPAYLDRQI